MRFRRERKKSWTSSVIDLTPLIDVVFLLLLFFLLTAAPAPDPTMAVHLPKATSGAVEKVPDEVELVLRDDGKILFQGQEYSFDRLSTELKQIAAKKPATRVILRGDRKAQYESFIGLLEVVNGANLSLSVAVEQKETKK
ncbi:biopolymer transporter ExbD [Myxococcota bacterium]|nr:biopolymer transporter ExbD [Myxococcota bacterium]